MGVTEQARLHRRMCVTKKRDGHPYGKKKGKEKEYSKVRRCRGEDEITRGGTNNTKTKGPGRECLSAIQKEKETRQRVKDTTTVDQQKRKPFSASLRALNGELSLSLSLTALGGGMGGKGWHWTILGTRVTIWLFGCQCLLRLAHIPLPQC